MVWLEFIAFEAGYLGGTVMAFSRQPRITFAVREYTAV